MPSAPIRVLLVEDSPVALTILQRLLADVPEIEVVGTARNGLEALEKIPVVKPTVVCTDLHMPKMGGLELTRRIMAECPRPILVISASVQEEDTQKAFQILEAGALDIFPKPRSGLPSDYDRIKTELVSRIKVLAGVSVFTQRYPRGGTSQTAPSAFVAKAPASVTSSPITPKLDIRAPRVVAIGASTGGPQALHTILKQLPASFPVPILCVQHISEGFLQGLVDWLNGGCALRVTIAQAGEAPQPGTVYFAPERYHLQLDPQGRFSLLSAPPVSGHCPSITVLFEAVASFYRRSSVAILLTGMGRDGADGLATIAQAGGTTIAQDEASCVVFGMPKVAISLGAAQHVLPLPEIASLLLTKVVG